jgi:hypothetical protein
MAKGELGIGYWDSPKGLKKIIKAGDGKHVWNELPQLEYVITDDLILTQDFGKHKTHLGKVNAGGQGMTMSEWIVDALREVKDPMLTNPNFTLDSVLVKTEPEGNEIGSVVKEVSWRGTYYDGICSYGTTDKNNDTIYANITPEYGISYIDVEGNILPVGTEKEGSYTFAPATQTIVSGNNLYGRFVASCYWPDAQYFALNSVGEPTEYKIVGGTSV